MSHPKQEGGARVMVQVPYDDTCVLFYMENDFGVQPWAQVCLLSGLESLPGWSLHTFAHPASRRHKLGHKQ